MIQMFPLKKIYVGHAALISYSEKALWSPSKETLRLVRQPICTPWFVIWLVPLWEFSETLSREAIILSTPHAPGAGVRTWSLEAVQLNLYHNTGLEHPGLVGSAPDTAKAVVLKSCQKQPAAQHPGCWCCTNDAQWMAQTSREGGARQFLLNHWTEAGSVCNCLLTLVAYCYVRFWVPWESLTAWLGWLEWVRIKMLMWPQSEGCVYIVYMGTIPWWTAFHCPPFFALLQALGGWSVRTISTGCLTVWLQVTWPSGSPSRRSVEGGVGESVSLVVSLQGGQWEVIALSGACPTQLLVPIATLPPTPSGTLGECQCTVITSPGLLHSSS